MAGSVNARRLTRKMPLTRSSMISSSGCCWSMASSGRLCAVPYISQHRDAAAGAEMLAGDERGFRRAKESDRGGNLGRMGEPAHAGRPPGSRAAHVLEKLRVGPPRLAKARQRLLAG